MPAWERKERWVKGKKRNPIIFGNTSPVVLPQCSARFDNNDKKTLKYFHAPNKKKHSIEVD